MKNASVGNNRKAYFRAWKIAHRKQSNAQAIARYWKNPEIFRAKNRATYQKQKAKGFDFSAKALRLKWGLSREDYSNLLFLQGNECAICGRNKPKGFKYFSVDHDHRNGKIRGLLCSSCNIILGHAEDKVDILRNAIAYLNRYTTTSDSFLYDPKNFLKC